MNDYYLKNKARINKNNNTWYKNHKAQRLAKIALYRKTYPWLVTYYTAKARCENPKNISYSYYGLKGIKFNLTTQEIKDLWFKDKAYLMKKPSIDRLDNKKDYTFKNCQFIELSKNCIKRDKELNQKKILQYTLNGIFIKEWNSITEAEKFLKLGRNNIYQCLSGKYKSCHGFIWRYKT